MSVENNNEPSWFIDEGIPGIGERPAWLNEKYKSVADLAKSNSELEKRLGTVPDEYDFTQSKFLDPDYVPFQELQQIAKDKRVPKEFIDKMIDSVDKYMDEFNTDSAEELKKLGDNAKERITTLDNWAKANLTKDSYEALSLKLNNAGSIKALEELRGKMMSNVTQVPGNNGQAPSTVSVADLKLELAQNLQKYKTDENYRNDISKRLEVAVKNSPDYIDKVGA